MSLCTDIQSSINYCQGSRFYFQTTAHKRQEYFNSGEATYLVDSSYTVATQDAAALAGQAVFQF